MRAGIAASAVFHTSLIVLAVVGLNGAEPLEPQQIESIAIDLVPVTEFSNIRTGALDSNIIETETPSAVETPDPATLGERAGNTQEDQPTPEQADKATPAPTVQTAPEPEAIVAPEPEPAPEPTPEVKPEQVAEPAAPAPAPTPSPTPEPLPELAATPNDAPSDQPTAPQPVIKTASIDQKRAEFKRKKAAEAKKRAAAREAEKQAKAKEADRVSDIINAEKSRGATTGAGGQKTAGKPTGQAATLTQSEQAALAAQMRKCWSPPIAALSEPGMQVRLLVELDRGGQVSSSRILSQLTSSVHKRTASAAQRAVIKCGPYKLAAEKYDNWRQVDVTFDPRDL